MGEVGKAKVTKPANFEVAITATGFGRFNILLLLSIIPPALTQVFETAALSYVFPVAQCDLGLTLEDKGLLNATIFAGMISSALLWGLLCDTLGRRNIMIYGYLLTGFFSLIASVSQNVTMLITAKFFGGFVINGPFSATISYLSEFHATQYRARIQLVRGIFITTGNVILPLIAWGILPKSLNLTLFGYFDIHAWNIFMFICALLPITSGLIFIFMPESPKFLMSDEKYDEAIKVCQKIYRINTRQPVESYPIKELIDDNVIRRATPMEKKTRHSVKSIIKPMLLQMKPLFCTPNLSKLVLVCVNACILMASLNSLLLWLPQLFQAVTDLKITNNSFSPNVCDLFEELIAQNVSDSSACVVNLDNSSVYINSVIVGTSQVVGFVVAVFFVNILGKKKLLFILTSVSGCCALLIYFAQGSNTLLIFSAIFLALASISRNLTVTITLELFPTSLRVMALCLHGVCARIGIISGNLIFPVLLHTGCASPFAFASAFVFGSALLTILIPNTDDKALK